MLAHRSTLLVYSIESPFGSFIDFFSPRYENSFEWPDGTRGLLKTDERVYFSLTENPKWRLDTRTPTEWLYTGNALNLKRLSNVHQNNLTVKMLIAHMCVMHVIILNYIKYYNIYTIIYILSKRYTWFFHQVTIIFNISVQLYKYIKYELYTKKYYCALL